MNALAMEVTERAMPCAIIYFPSTGFKISILGVAQQILGMGEP